MPHNLPEFHQPEQYTHRKRSRTARRIEDSNIPKGFSYGMGLLTVERILHADWRKEFFNFLICFFTFSLLFGLFGYAIVYGERIRKCILKQGAFIEKLFFCK